MSKKIVILLLLITNLIVIPIYSQEYNISFISKLYDGNWGRYIGARDRGPYFLNENTAVFIDENNSLITIDLDENLVSEKPLGSQNTKLYKIGEVIIVSIGNRLYSFDGLELISPVKNIPLSDNLYYSLNSGLYRLESGKMKPILIPGGISINAPYLSDIPVLSNDQNSIYFSVWEDEFAGSLYRYSLINEELQQ